MAAEKEYGVIERVKSLMSGGNAKPRIPVSGLNLPWMLARCDCAFRELLPLVRGSIFVKECGEREEYYAMLVRMVTDIIDTLNVIYREMLRSAKGHKIDPDPGIPVLKVVAASMELLHASAVLAKKMQMEKAPSEAFAGTGILVRFNGIDDTVSNVEVEMLHNVSELLESISPAMQRTAEQRKKSLSKNGMECYLRAEQELSLHYSGLSGKN